MTRMPVASSAVYSIGYDSGTSLLEIQFAPSKSGQSTVYQYAGVLPDDAKRLIEATSIGRALAEIRQNYAGTLVATVDADGVETPIEVPAS